MCNLEDDSEIGKRRWRMVAVEPTGDRGSGGTLDLLIDVILVAPIKEGGGSLIFRRLFGVSVELLEEDWDQAPVGESLYISMAMRIPCSV